MSKKAFEFLALLLVLCVAGSLLLGKYGFGASDYARYVVALLKGENLKDFEVMHTLLLEIRLPRILACVLIGASLAISGAAYQAMFVNPLVSPSILGVLSGAGFGAGRFRVGFARGIHRAAAEVGVIQRDRQPGFFL